MGSEMCIRDRSIAMMAKEGSTKIVNFMIPGAEVLLLGHDHLSHIAFVCLFLCLLLRVFRPI